MERGSLEIGGDYHWAGLPPEPKLPWPEEATWYALSRHAVLELWNRLENTGSLWLPSYFCYHIAGWWEKRGIKLRAYDSDPRDAGPRWESIGAQSGDFVLAVNYFGASSGAGWGEWRDANPQVVLIEDHSHDLLSTWARESKADYAFGSVRKCFMSPDGGVLWSPRGHELPAVDSPLHWHASALKLAAMMWKAEYLQGHGSLSDKENFRSFQLNGESQFDDMPCVTVSPWSKVLVGGGYPIPWRQRREANVRRFLGKVKWNETVQPLFTVWPEGHCPFAAMLLFAGQQERDAMRRHLIENNVYPPVHWGQDPNGDARAIELSQRILTIPLDQRYGESEVDYVAALVNKFST